VFSHGGGDGGGVPNGKAFKEVCSKQADQVGRKSQRFLGGSPTRETIPSNKRGGSGKKDRKGPTGRL